MTTPNQVGGRSGGRRGERGRRGRRGKSPLTWARVRVLAGDDPADLLDELEDGAPVNVSHGICVVWVHEPDQLSLGSVLT